WVSNFSAVARSPDSAASSNVALPAAAALPRSGKEHKRHKKHRSLIRDTTSPLVLRILDLRQRIGAVADRLDRNVVPFGQGQQKIGMTRILRILQMLAAFDASMRMAEDCRGQRIVIVTIAVTHVAAEQDRGMIENGSIRFLHRHQLLDESRKHLGVVLLNLYQ